MTKIALFCDLQRLNPTYDANFVHLTLNVSVAVDQSAAVEGDLALLQPWTWTIQPPILMYGINGTTVGHTALQTELVPSKPTLDNQAWFDSLASVQERFKADGDLAQRFTWSGELQ